MWVGNQHTHPLISCDSLAAPHSCFLTMFLFLSPPPPPLRPTPQHPRLWCGRPPFGRPVPPRHPSRPLLPYSVVNPPALCGGQRPGQSGRAGARGNLTPTPNPLWFWLHASGRMLSGIGGQAARAAALWLTPEPAQHGTPTPTHPHSHAPPLPRTPEIHPTQTGKRYKSKPLFPNRQQKSPEFFIRANTKDPLVCGARVFHFPLPDTDWLV